MPLIKSHSNYVLKKKHQLVNDGTVYERDITTIGAVNQFAPGQIPIYRSGNFIITVRDDRRGTNQYNTKKWEKGFDGETWTLSTVDKMTSDDVLQDDTKIVLKSDYYDFREFAYYGSLTELFRASINDALARFPGELYMIPGNGDVGGVYYTVSRTEDFEKIENKVRLGGDDYYEISNPFGINIHTEEAPPGADPLKYFANDGFKVYEVIKGETHEEIIGWEVISFDPCDENPKYWCRVSSTANTVDGRNPQPIQFTATEGGSSSTTESARKVADIIIRTLNNTYIFYAYLGDNGVIHYLYKKSGNTYDDFHIRPNSKVITTFYNESNDLQRIMFAQDTNPKYKATFSVIGGDDYGYTRKLETFTYPTSEGGYNLAVSSDYLNRLIEIGEFYDEYFTDNLYRSMTHEAIKNFDWTYTREYNEGDELEYVHGGEKIKKALRIFAREFDEVKKYIDNIKYTGRLTYDERGNIPDYFLSDICEDDGWDVESVIPYDLNGDDAYWSNETSIMTNVTKHEYSQSSVSSVTPYISSNVKDGTKDGYFVKCNTTSNIGGCLGGWYPGGSGCNKLGVIKADDTYTIFNRCDGTSRLEQKIKPYIDDTAKYTYMDVNYEFLKRLKLNSRALWRHKGTVEGLEMILGMFGLKSKRWLERNKSCRYENYRGNKCDGKYDYEIIEYTQFTNKITDTWDDQLNNFKYDWLNSTKTITYDYRSVSNYTKPGAMGMTYVPYQGLPVSYRNPYGEDESTSKTRYLYPNFDKNEQLDGNPYFQMDGGWLAKTINGSHNFQFDVDDNIVENRVESNPRSDNGFIVDNHKLYKETVRSIKRVEDLNELVSLPQQDLYDGIICFVGRISSEVAVIDGGVFDIEKDVTGQFIRFTLKGGYIQVGDLYFDESIVVYDVYDENLEPTVYSLDDKFDGYELRAYIRNTGTDENPVYDFICYSNENSNYGITNFKVIGEDEGSEELSNYYVLDDTVFSHNISHGYDTNGWRRLKKTDPDYLKINTVENYYEGNNGHNGNLHYDSGHEYFTYFQRLFKYAEDNSLFDTRCYREGFDDVYQEVHNIGFQNLINPIEDIKDYDKYLSADTKVHYFGNSKRKYSYTVVKYKFNNVDEDTDRTLYVIPQGYSDIFLEMRIDNDGWKTAKEKYKLDKGEHTVIYSYKPTTINIEPYFSGVADYVSRTEYPAGIYIYGVDKKYQYKCKDTPCGKQEEDGTMICDPWECFYKQYNNKPLYYSIGNGIPNSFEIQPHTSSDDVTNQIVNNKRIKIIFYMKSQKFASKDGQIELKYMDKIVMNYLTQMLPSTVITDIEYNFCNYNYTGC